jgi:putative NADH-flavin reductase
MKVLLFGATGRVGSFALEYALAKGHAVTAVVRDPAKLRQSHSLLRKLAGDIYQPEALLQAIDPGFEVVLSCVGGNVMRPSTVVADSARLIVELMRQRAIPRLLAVSGVAAIPEQTWSAKAGAALMRLSPIRHGVIDHDNAYAIIASSGLDYTLAGCPHIKDGPRSGSYIVHTGRYAGGYHSVSPPDVADFLVTELTESRYPRQIVGIWS